MKIPRRDFITALGSAAITWPLAARAQQPERMRRIGMLLPAAPDDSQFQTWVRTFLQGLAQLGWTDGGNVRIDTRWATANAAEIRRHAAELAALAPDVIVAHGSVTVGPMLQATRTVPIVFPISSDPVAAGFVYSMARPGGNITGFTMFEYSLSAKWLELPKQIAPGVTRAAVFRDPAIPAGIGQFGRARPAVNPESFCKPARVPRTIRARYATGGGTSSLRPRRGRSSMRIKAIKLTTRHSTPSAKTPRKTCARSAPSTVAVTTVPLPLRSSETTGAASTIAPMTATMNTAVSPRKKFIAPMAAPT